MKIEPYTELEVHTGCGHSPPKKFDSFIEAFRYARAVSQESHYLGGTTPAQIVRREIISTVWTFKNGQVV